MSDSSLRLALLLALSDLRRGGAVVLVDDEPQLPKVKSSHPSIVRTSTPDRRRRVEGLEQMMIRLGAARSSTGASR